MTGSAITKYAIAVGQDLFDDWFGFPDMRDMDKTEKKLYGRHPERLMKTDVHEHEDHFEVDIDLPGFHRDEIEVELKDGYMIISAQKALDKDEKKEGKVIRQERYSGVPKRFAGVRKIVMEFEEPVRSDKGSIVGDFALLKAFLADHDREISVEVKGGKDCVRLFFPAYLYGFVEDTFARAIHHKIEGSGLHTEGVYR